MLRQFITLLTIVLYISGTAAAQTETGGGSADGDAAAVEFIGTVFHGIGMGAFTGLSAGWVRYADRYEMQNVWESAGYGAVAGLGLGLTAAIIGKNGAGNLVLNDIDRVSGVGGSIGFLWGVTSALFTGDSCRVADGLAWGNLAGFVLGAGIAGFKIAAGRYRGAGARTPPACTVYLTGGQTRMVRVEKRF